MPWTGNIEISQEWVLQQVRNALPWLGAFDKSFADALLDRNAEEMLRGYANASETLGRAQELWGLLESVDSPLRREALEIVEVMQSIRAGMSAALLEYLR